MVTAIKRVSIPLLVALGLVVSLGLVATPDARSAQAAETSVGLGDAGSFAVLAATTVTNTGPTILSGDLGVNPGSSITGFSTSTPPGPGIVNNGTVHATDTLSGLAQNDLVTAYNDAAGRTNTASGLAALDNMTLVSGVYAGGALSLGGNLTLKGSATDVFIFKAASTLDVGLGAHVLFKGGASACNVFWQVTSSAVLETGADFAGTIMAYQSVTAKNGATITGRLLARDGAVTLDANTITRPASCVTSAPGTPPTPLPGRARYTG